MIDRSDLHNLFLLGYALLETLNVHSKILSTLDILIFSMRFNYISCYFIPSRKMSPSRILSHGFS